MNPTKVDRLVKFIIERHRIWKVRNEGKPKPWTQDKILQTYRFCNVYRELDAVTIWIANNWRNPFAKESHLWFAMVVARLVNQPNTLEELGFPLPWNPKKFVKVLQSRAALGELVFNSAYIVSTNGHKMNKAEYLEQKVLTPLWETREEIQPIKKDTCRMFFKRLNRFNGMGSFMAAQVLADIKYVNPLLRATDWFTFAASGPGSRRGLNRVCGRPTDAGWNEGEWWSTLKKLLDTVTPLLEKEKMPPLHAQDLQNCLCEFDKYERVRQGEGRPKSLYPGV